MPRTSGILTKGHEARKKNMKLKILKEISADMLNDKIIQELGQIKKAVRSGATTEDLSELLESLQHELEEFEREKNHPLKIDLDGGLKHRAIILVSDHMLVKGLADDYANWDDQELMDHLERHAFDPYKNWGGQAIYEEIRNKAQMVIDFYNLETE